MKGESRTNQSTGGAKSKFQMPMDNDGEGDQIVSSADRQRGQALTTITLRRQRLSKVRI